MLTPVEDVLKVDVSALARTDSGVVLLNENLDWIDGEGKRWNVVHRILKAFAEDGVKKITSTVQEFRKTDQTIHLVLARSIQPDGSRMPVKADAAFIQTPQYEAAYSLYTDTAELVIVFPKVGPGTVVEYLTLLEEPKAAIPGEYTAVFTFQSYWPTLLIRKVVELPAVLAGRLRIAEAGRGVPKPRREDVPGRLRWVWLRENAPKITWEISRAPLDQVGPVIRLTTLPGWEAVADWYRSLSGAGTSSRLRSGRRSTGSPRVSPTVTG